VVASVLPTSRSVQVAQPATLFATIVNAGDELAQNCRIEQDPSLGADLSYQTTDPATNALVGLPNTPVDLAPLAAQTFVITLTSGVAIVPVEAAPLFVCDNANPATAISGVNTFNYSVSNAPVPDVIALGATVSRDGVVVLPTSVGSNVFTVATVNVGTQATVSAQAILSQPLPAVVSLCQTDPVSSACINPTSPTTGPVSVDMDSDVPATFGVFVGASQDIAFDPARNRIKVEFTDADGALRGATSVALRVRTSGEPLPFIADQASDTLTIPLELTEALSVLSSYTLGALNLFTSGETETADCVGTVTYAFDDLDANGVADSGDVIDLDFDGCRVFNTASAGELTGLVQVSLTDTQYFSGGEVLISGMLETVGVVEQAIGNQIKRISGKYSFSYRHSRDADILELRAGSDGRLQMDDEADQRTFTDFELVSTLVRNQSPDYNVAFTGSVTSARLNGTYNCNATNLIGRPENAPVAGQLDCASDAGGAVRLDGLGQALFDVEGNGGFELIRGVPGWQGRIGPALFHARVSTRSWPGQVDVRRPVEELAAALVADISVSVNDLAASELTGRVYVANAAGILIYDPLTAELLGNVATPNTVLAMDLADDQKTLWLVYDNVPQVQSYDVQADQFGVAFGLGTDAVSGDDLFGKDVAAVPGTSNAVVVSLREKDVFPDERGIALFEDGQQVGSRSGFEDRPSDILFVGDRLYAESQGLSAIIEYNQGSAGVARDKSYVGFGSLNSLSRAYEGRLVIQTGRVVDLQSERRLGAFAESEGGGLDGAISIDEQNRRAMSISDDELRLFDLDRYITLATYESPLDDRLVAEANVANVSVVASRTKLVFINRSAIVEAPREPCLTTDLSQFNPATGAVQFTCKFNDMVFDPTGNKIYASLKNDTGSYSHTVLQLDPVSLQIEQSYLFPGEPDQLRLSADHGTLFVAMRQTNFVVELALDTGAMTNGPAFTRVDDEGRIQYTEIISFAASPSDPDEYAVRLSGDGLRLVRDGAIASQGIANEDIRVGQFDYSSDLSLVGASFTSLQNVAVSAAGLTQQTSVVSRIEIFSRQVFDDALYFDSGQRLDLSSGVVEQRYDVERARSLAIDRGADEVVFLTGLDTELLVFDQQTGAELGSLSIPFLGFFGISSPGRNPDVVIADVPDRYLIMRDSALVSVAKSEVAR